MNFKIDVVSDRILKGERSFDFLPLFKLFLKHNLGVSSFNISSDYALNREQPTFLFMHDEKIDAFLEKEKEYFAGKSEIIDEAGVLMAEGNYFAIIPLEGNVLELSDKILTKICQKASVSSTAIFRLFGEEESKVKEKLDELGIKGEVVSDGLLSDIYLPHSSSFISDDEVKLTQAFENQLYCESYIPMPQIVAKLLNLTEAKLSISDAFTGGTIAKEILSYHKKNIISKTFNLIQEGNFVKVEGKERCFGDEQDAVYQLAYSNHEEEKSDISLVVAGRQEGNFFKIFIALGSHKTVDVYKLSLSGSYEDALGIAVNTAIFNLIKKLRLKDFAK